MFVSALAVSSCASQTPPNTLLGIELSGSGRVVSEPPGIDCPDDCSEGFEPGTSVRLEATAGAGASFVQWGGDCEGVAPSCGLVVNGPMQVTASFAKSPIRVNDLSDSAGGENCSLPDAIEAANADTSVAGCEAGNGADVIELPPAAVITLTRPHEDADGPTGLPSITSEITIVGAGGTIERDASEPFRLLHVGADGSLHLEDLTLAGGHADGSDGGAVYVGGGTLTAKHVTFQGNIAGNSRAGGAVYNEGGTVDLVSVTMLGNSAPGSTGGPGWGAAAANEDGEMSIADSEFRGNGGFLTDESGVIASLGFDAQTLIVDTIISDNGAPGLFNAGKVNMERVEVSLSASEQVGGIVNQGIAFLTDVTIDDNDAELVSGVHNTGYMRLRSASVTNHQTAIGFTGVRNEGIMEVIESVISDNDSFGSSGVGGGVTNSGRLTIVDSRVVGNRSDEGGGVRNTGDLILIGSTVDANAAAFGGGIHSAGSVDLLAGSTVGGEEGNSASVNGGGIYVAGTAETNRVSLEGGSAVRGNVAAGDGGGIFAEEEFGLGLCAACAIELNSSESGVGGGVYAPGLGFGSIFAPGIRDNVPDAVAPGTLLVLTIAAPEDDAEEIKQATDALPVGAVKLDEPVMELPRDAALGVGQVSGLRFTDVQVPAGASVVDARLVFTSAAAEEGKAALLVAVEDSATPAAFTQTQSDISNRTRLGSTFWELEPWAADESGPRQSSPSLRNQLQLLVDTPEWSAGSDVAFIVESASGENAGAARSAHTYDGDPAKAAQLWLLYFETP